MANYVNVIREREVTKNRTTHYIGTAALMLKRVLGGTH